MLVTDIFPFSDNVLKSNFSNDQTLYQTNLDFYNRDVENV